jgi:hypothetical protein
MRAVGSVGAGMQAGGSAGAGMRAAGSAGMMARVRVMASARAIGGYFIHLSCHVMPDPLLLKPGLAVLLAMSAKVASSFADPRCKYCTCSMRLAC